MKGAVEILKTMMNFKTDARKKYSKEIYMRKTIFVLIALLVAALALSACGGGGAGADEGAGAGQDLFEMTVIGTQAGCVTCHSRTAGEVIVGPSLAGIGTRGDADYIRESILNPNAVLVEGFSAGTMPDVWGEELSDEQIDQLVAYLLTLK
jgi:mono/diheme cytochrome c family protein